MLLTTINVSIFKSFRRILVCLEGTYVEMKTIPQYMVYDER